MKILDRTFIVRIKRIINRQETIIVVTDHQINMSTFNTIMSYYAARFYSEEGHHDINNGRLLTCMAGIIANCSDFRAIRPWQSMANAYKTAGIELIMQEMTKDEFMIFVTNDERTQEFIDLFGDDIGYVLQDTKTPFVICLTIVMGMVKTLTTANYFKWTEGRVRTFAGTLGDTYTMNNYKQNMYPKLSAFNGLNAIASANHVVRKELYFAIVAIGVQKKNFITMAFAEVHHLMRGHEMQHLILIDKYIFEEHPELLDTVLLRGLKPRFGQALQLLKEQNVEDRLYIKISKIQNGSKKCVIRSRNHFYGE
ncbi:uncharacterized protein LOC115886143 [Sitophilus oryzae]|uniref:Uncharacterized protein LOC115886143 n=1 Tax=Sitophilus oryzae TaxID=7048 RepID=A0A6J2YB27_SITOR|nr:uncharacterized protein LOC115886143 [Sitophilus oryzae]